MSSRAQKLVEYGHQCREGDETMSNEDRIAKLERELAELKAQMKPEEPEKPKEERKPWPKYDPTEGMGMSAEAAKRMAWPEAKGEFDPGAWARTKVAEPGGLVGPEKGPKEERRPAVAQHIPLGSPPGVAICDQMMDVQDQLDKRDLERRLKGER
jgi:hypothetical protein